MADADEALARRLQQEFDMEEERERQDGEMARALAAGHGISDSDPDSGNEQSASKPSGSVSRKPNRLNKGHGISDSDSDVTFVEEEEDRDGEEGNANNSHPGKKSAKKRRRRTSESEDDSDETDLDEKEEPSKSRGGARKKSEGTSKSMSGAKTKSQEKRARISQSTKRMKKSDAETPDQGGRSGGPSTSSADKPECPFGAECYRKNKWHLEEYSHPDQWSPSKSSPKKKGTSSSSKPRGPLSCPEVIERASPYGFVLTKVAGIQSAYNNVYAVHIRDILHPCMGQLVASAQFNYMFDIPWLMNQYPKESRNKPLLVVHGEQREGNIAMHEDAHPYPNIKLCQAKLEIMYGTHHSKMMFLLYTNGMRVVIHTSNIVESDWHQKTQGVWISPLFPKLSAVKPSATDGESATFFKRDLLAYLTAYKAPALLPWKEHITQHDMSQARVFLVSSVPGRHLGESKDKWGHLKVRRVLLQHGPDGQSVKGWPVIGQFSSIGSLGPDRSKWLCAEWLQSLSSVKGQRGPIIPDANIRHLKLIFPCSDNVRTSLEGYPAGASLPYSIQTARKQPYLHSFFHQWKASTVGRNRACPHIKTYSRLSPDSNHIAWFMVTSANMSKAAWGALEKNGSQLMIRSYEIGVLMLPKMFHKSSHTFAVSEEGSDGQNPVFRLPWDVPLTPYGKGDRPWIWDIPWMDKPDSNGNAWVPGGR